MKAQVEITARTMVLAAVVLVALSALIGATHVRRAKTPLALPMGFSQERAEISRERLLEDEVAWLLACQMPCGAIAQTPSGADIVPYFSNLAAVTMTDFEPDGVRAYITWYLENTNKPDRHGVFGTIYDYRLAGDEYVPTYNYDSADSYAATFLSLVRRYSETTGDRDFVANNLESIDLVAQVLLHLQTEDGLVAVAPRSPTRYLMDNCEVYRGLIDWAAVLESLELEEMAAPYKEAADGVERGIENVLFDPAKDSYAWVSSWYGRRFPKARKWYPDAVSQFDLIFSGLLDPRDPKAASMWREFNLQFPRWSQGEKEDVFPWTKIALLAQTMGDCDRVADFLGWTASIVDGGRQYPWYVLESAGLVELCRQASHSGELGNYEE